MRGLFTFVAALFSRRRSRCPVYWIGGCEDHEPFIPSARPTQHKANHVVRIIAPAFSQARLLQNFPAHMLMRQVQMIQRGRGGANLCGF